MNIEFKKALLPDEIDALVDFDRKVFHDFPDDIFTADDWDNFESYWMFVDGQKVGCSSVQHNVDFDEHKRSGYLWIANTAILPEFQNRHFGTILTQWQIDYARKRGFRVVVINMRESNVRIITLSRNLGFKFRRIKQHYYSNPDEATVVMQLDLANSRFG